MAAVKLEEIPKAQAAFLRLPVLTTFSMPLPKPVGQQSLPHRLVRYHDSFFFRQFLRCKRRPKIEIPLPICREGKRTNRIHYLVRRYFSVFAMAPAI
jgi:hypothetical protein